MEGNWGDRRCVYSRVEMGAREGEREKEKKERQMEKERQAERNLRICELAKN